MAGVGRGYLYLEFIGVDTIKWRVEDIADMVVTTCGVRLELVFGWIRLTGGI